MCEIAESFGFNVGHRPEQVPQGHKHRRLHGCNCAAMSLFGGRPRRYRRLTPTRSEEVVMDWPDAHPYSVCHYGNEGCKRDIWIGLLALSLHESGSIPEPRRLGYLPGLQAWLWVLSVEHGLQGFTAAKSSQAALLTARLSHQVLILGLLTVSDGLQLQTADGMRYGTAGLPVLGGWRHP